MGAGQSAQSGGLLKQRSTGQLNAAATLAALRLQRIVRRRQAQRIVALRKAERDAIAANEARQAARHEARLERRAERNRNRRASTCIQTKHRQRAVRWEPI
jgi:hypothetical protein